jgi:hypothetical protein
VHVMEGTVGRREKLPACRGHASRNGWMGTTVRRRFSAKRVTSSSANARHGVHASHLTFRNRLCVVGVHRAGEFTDPMHYPFSLSASWLDALNGELPVQCPTGALQDGGNGRPFDRSGLPW